MIGFSPATESLRTNVVRSTATPKDKLNFVRIDVIVFKAEGLLLTFRVVPRKSGC